MKNLLKTSLLGVAMIATTMGASTYAYDYSGVTYGNGTITITDGTTTITMADRNAGATEVGYGASASTASYGNYYQWGGTTGYAYSMSAADAIAAGFVTNWSTWATATSSIISWSTGPCPSGYHVPTSTEWNSVLSILNTNGISSASDKAAALKIPFAGGRISASIFNAGGHSNLWSASPYGEDRAYSFYMTVAGASMSNYDRYHANPVRCFANSSVPLSSSNPGIATAEINITVTPGALRILGLSGNTITLDTLKASFGGRMITGSFSNFVEVEDLKGSGSGYYVTVSATDMVSSLPSNLSGTEFYTIPKSNITFYPNYVSGDFKRAGVNNAQVEIFTGSYSFGGSGGVTTYIYRKNNTTPGLLGRYGTKPSISIDVPISLPAANYVGTIVFTLYEDYSTASTRTITVNSNVDTGGNLEYEQFENLLD